MTQQEEFQKICDNLAKLSLEEKIQQYVKKSNFTEGLQNLRLEHIIYAIQNHQNGLDGFNYNDLVISSQSVFLDIEMHNRELMQKYSFQYFDRKDWLFEACLDIYLGLHEIGFMNYANDTIYKLLRENTKLINELNKK